MICRFQVLLVLIDLAHKHLHLQVKISVDFP